MRREATGNHLLTTMCMSVKCRICSMSVSLGDAQYCAVVSGKITGLGIAIGRNAWKSGKVVDQLKLEL